MNEHVLEGIALTVILGIGAQWLGWRLKLPSILLLLIAGFVAGPVTHAIDPDAILGDALMPVVSISVGLILFEGGLTLKFSELKAIGSVVRNLITVGAFLVWVLTSVAAKLCFGWPWQTAILIGAIFVVTGPTVILPLLRHIQPAKRVGSILKWEGILIDPVGALLALLVFEAIRANEVWHDFPARALVGFGETILIGGILGVAGAAILIAVLKRHWAPDYLQNPVTLMLVIAIFTLSNHLHHESGLLSVTVMGIVLANQKRVIIRHIAEFKENLTVLIISGLFILLSARIKMVDLQGVSVWGTVGFLLALLLIVRPASVFASAVGSPLSFKEKVFLSWMAPRGIVAASVASIFAMRLADSDIEGIGQLVPVTFLLIIGTVLIYGLTAGVLARSLNLSNPNPQGVLIVGADRLCLETAKAVQKAGFSVLLLDTNRENIANARLAGIPAYHGSALAEHIGEKIDLNGIGRVLAMTPNREVNALAALHFVEFFGRREVYQLAPPKTGNIVDKPVTQQLKGRVLFDNDADHLHLAEKLANGFVIKTSRISEEYDLEAFVEHYGEEAVPLFVATEGEKLDILTSDSTLAPKAGRLLISLVDPRREVAEKPKSQDD